jgi:hypothetical protein
LDKTFNDKITLSNPKLSIVENFETYDEIKKLISEIQNTDISNNEEYINLSKNIFNLIKLNRNFEKYEQIITLNTTKISEPDIVDGERLIRFGVDKGKMRPNIILGKKININYYYPKNNTILWCSPFVRCMQTAKFISDLLNIDKIHIVYELSELCDDLMMQWFKSEFDSGSGVNIHSIYENSLEQLHELGISCDKFKLLSKGEHIYNDNQIIETEIKPYDKRIQTILHKIYNIPTVTPNSKKYNLVITHGDTLRCFKNDSGLKFYEKVDITEYLNGSFDSELSVTNISETMDGGYKINKYSYKSKILKYRKKNSLMINKLL